ncbi:ABC-type glycerol-3-phosphate transport system permease component [Saccharothrix ecbatanensis]|uniref:ABC-type glycerol-3-phosphate transport system permease component n=1 Tax=Saccharothrix ecbatanensis TaxID=1105145 RepID=A0A7W9HGR5_9PSEU|nr:ABC-type glycerol-3-phosphate transport system permease component [Saccharothrix ecbatanensis]
MAGSFLSTIPLVVVFILVELRMVAGILDGAFKG